MGTNFIRFLIDVGSILGGFGGALASIFGCFFGAFFDVRFETPLGIDFGALWVRFGIDFGSLWDAFWESVGVSWASLGCFSDLASDLKSCAGSVMLTFCARRLRERF